MSVPRVSSAKLLADAQTARQHAYAFYSGFAVGAALLARDGTVFTGVNVENAAYGSTICAERSALVAAVSQGYQDSVAIAVVADAEPFCTPCGACRQVLAEFNPMMRVIMANLGGRKTERRLDQLLALHFGHAALPKSGRRRPGRLTRGVR